MNTEQVRAQSALARAWEHVPDEDARAHAVIGVGYALLAIRDLLDPACQDDDDEREVVEEIEDRDDDLLTTAEVARRLRVGSTALNGWRKAGTGPTCAKFGNTVVYRRADVERWITERFG